MGLSLEVKKFDNSEHTGEYIDVEVKSKETSGDGKSAPSGVSIKLHYLDKGAGEPLLLLHSIGQSIYTWRKLYADLAEHYRVIAVDLPGHGFSARPHDFDYGITDYADALAALIKALKLQSTHVVGFSMASAYALQLARSCPERVGKVVIINPGGVNEHMPPFMRRLRGFLTGGVSSRLYSLRSVQSALEECFFDLTHVTLDVPGEYYRTISDAEARRAIRLSVRRFDEAALINELRAIETNVLVLWSNEDKWHTSDESLKYQTLLKNSKYAVVRNAGHIPHEEKPEKILHHIREYIPTVV